MDGEEDVEEVAQEVAQEPVQEEAPKVEEPPAPVLKIILEKTDIEAGLSNLQRTPGKSII